MFREIVLKDVIEYYKNSTDKLLDGLDEKERRDLAVEHYLDFTEKICSL